MFEELRTSIITPPNLIDKAHMSPKSFQGIVPPMIALCSCIDDSDREGGREGGAYVLSSEFVSTSKKVSLAD